MNLCAVVRCGKLRDVATAHERRRGFLRHTPVPRRSVVFNCSPR